MGTNHNSNGWSGDAVGPGGLAALVVATLGLPSTYYVEIRASLWQAMARMYLDPRWAEIKTPEDAKALVREYL